MPVLVLLRDETVFIYFCLHNDTDKVEQRLLHFPKK